MRKLIFAALVGTFLSALPSWGAVPATEPVAPPISPAAVAVNPIPPTAVMVQEGDFPCPDSSFITIRIWDVNPDDPAAPVFFAWYRGNVLVAVRQKDSPVVFLAAEKRNVPLEELIARGLSGPCDLPF